MRLFSLITAIFLLSSCSISPSNTVIDKSLSKYFNKHGVEGCFILYDLKKNQYIKYHPERLKKAMLPASTFKIFSSLAILESGVVPDENFMIKWDGVKRWDKWDKDYNLREAFKNSTVWFYQELIRRIGYPLMQKYIDKAGYGNRNIQGGIDQFWLSGELRITAEEQIELLKRLYRGQLPFSKRTMDITKDIMIEEKSHGRVLRSKTGSTDYDGSQLGWYVGYIEQNDNVYFFAMNIEAELPQGRYVNGKWQGENWITGKAVTARKPITREILAQLI